MLSHVSLGTNDAARAAAFYDPVLAVLGIRKLHERDAVEFVDHRPGLGREAHVDPVADAGRPGLRPKYDANYYGAFVRDPDGNKIEAVSFLAE